jgi:hypothetical protein
MVAIALFAAAQRRLSHKPESDEALPLRADEVIDEAARLNATAA